VKVDSPKRKSIKVWR